MRSGRLRALEGAIVVLVAERVLRKAKWLAETRTTRRVSRREMESSSRVGGGVGGELRKGEIVWTKERVR